MTDSAWPDSYIDWARNAKPVLAQQVATSLRNLLLPNSLPADETKELAEQAALEAFNLAYGHQRDPGYFQDENQFKLWLGTVAFREALRLLLRHDRVEPQLHALPGDQCQLLGMVYLDRLFYGDVAPILRIRPDEVRQQQQNALNALFQLLRQKG
jgi:DNA-directed RNA polymerase specialized sigma24 family protein